MNPILKLAISHIKKYKVIRSMPGRLRINITGVRQYPDIARRFVPAMEATLAAKHGIEKAEISPITGNLLIVYDVSQICETEILLWLDNAAKTVADTLTSPDTAAMADAKIVAKIRRELSKTE